MYVVFDEIFEKQIEIKQEIALKTRFKINTVNSRFKKDVNLQIHLTEYVHKAFFLVRTVFKFSTYINLSYIKQLSI